MLVLALPLACAGRSFEHAEGAGGPVGVQVAIDPLAEADLAPSARRGLEPRLDEVPLVPIARSHPAVGRLRGKGSLSIGTSRDGFVVDCKVLPLRSDTLQVLEVQSHRGTNCGTDEIVDALVKASRDVAHAVPGSVMTVGNVGRVGGGDIPWSISHNSGRDADIGFFLLGPDGGQFIPPELVKLDSSGRGVSAGVPVRLDLRRTWLVVRSLVTNPAVEVQWLFVSDAIRKTLLDFARKRHEPEAVIRRAEEAMAQPARTRPHDDHLHLRIYCPVDDLLEGCRDTGTNRPWYVDRADRVQARVDELMALLRSRDPAERAGAITVLARLGRGEATQQAASMLGDRDAAVRLAAARALGEIDVSGRITDIERRIADCPDDAVAATLLQAVDRRLSGEARAASLARLLAVGRPFTVDVGGVFQARWTVASWARDALARRGDVASVRALADALGRPGVDAAAVSSALKDLTGVDAPADAGGGDPAEAWRGWWARHRHEEPIRWHEEAMAGVIAGRNATAADVPALVEVIRKGDWRGRAALAVLGAALGRKLPRLPPDGIEPTWVLVERALALPEAPPADADP